MEFAGESKETTYFDEEAAAAKEAVEGKRPGSRSSSIEAARDTRRIIRSACKKVVTFVVASAYRCT